MKLPASAAGPRRPGQVEAQGARADPRRSWWRWFGGHPATWLRRGYIIYIYI